MKKTSASARQLVWVLALTALLALPLTSAYLPGWQVLPGWAKLEMPAPQSAQPVAAASEDLYTGMDSSPPPEAAPDPWIGHESELPGGTEPRTAIAPMPSEGRLIFVKFLICSRADIAQTRMPSLTIKIEVNNRPILSHFSNPRAGFSG